MITYAPSVYEFRSEMEWEQAMNEWIAENNEPRYLYWAVLTDQPQYSILARIPANQIQKSFESKEERSAWLAENKHLNLVSLSEGSTFPGIVFPKRYLAPGANPATGAPDHLPGGSRSDYRMAGYNRY